MSTYHAGNLSHGGGWSADRDGGAGGEAGDAHRMGGGEDERRIVQVHESSFHFCQGKESWQ